jgi:hypothetical protein
MVVCLVEIAMIFGVEVVLIHLMLAIGLFGSEAVDFLLGE